MFGRKPMFDLVVKNCMKVKPGQEVFILSDDYVRSIKISEQIAEACELAGAEAVMAIMKRRTRQGHEPPLSIGAAMLEADVIFHVADNYDIVHTDARMKATEKGILFVNAMSHLSEDYFSKEISLDDMELMKERSERLAEIASRSDEARITSPYGTDLKMSLKGRKGIPIHPLGSTVVTVPDYAETAIAPVEGTTEGMLVADASVQTWNFVLREPIRLTIKKGKVAGITGPEDYVKRFNDELLAVDDNASNCACELGIATGHTQSKDLQGWSWEYGLAGTAHIGLGRNNDIGGTTFSLLHKDVLITKPTVWLDDLCVLENGELKV